MCGKRGASACAVEDQGLGSLLIVEMDPAVHRLVMAAGLLGHLGGIFALGDLVQGQESFSGPWMGGLLSEEAKVLGRLAPAGEVYMQHPL